VPDRETNRLQWVRANLLLCSQSGIAAGLAWFLAHQVVGHPRPFFAPISAVVVLVAGSGQRTRRAVEMVFGVALGIAVGDALVAVIGVGAVQIAAVVVLAMLATVLLGGGAVAVGQAAASAVLVATLAPPSHGIYYDRFVDSLVGGACALAVMLLLLPFDPLRAAHRCVEPVLAVLAHSLDLAATALTGRDAAGAAEALRQLRSTDTDLARLRDTLVAGHETVALSPLRWRARAGLAVYAEAAPYLDRAVRNCRVLLRRCVSTIEDDEPVPDGLPQGLALLADAVRTLRRELATGREPVRCRDRILAAVATVTAAYGGTGFSGNVVVAQVRSAGLDLLQATGLDRDRARKTLRSRGATGRWAGSETR
jgi:uncharacterized membrane protein YgaE (UPF0421/DUF939 family)